MSSWDVVVDFFSGSVIPASEYVYMIAIIGLGVVALWYARRMVADI